MHAQTYWGTRALSAFPRFLGQKLEDVTYLNLQNFGFHCLKDATICESQHFRLTSIFDLYFWSFQMEHVNNLKRTRFVRLFYHRKIAVP